MKNLWNHAIFTLLSGAFLSLNATSEIGLFSQGDQELPECVPCGYSFPSGIQLCKGPNITLSVAYIGWYANQGGFDLATTGLYDTQLNTIGFLPTTETVKYQNPSYSSGFKLNVSGETYSDQWLWTLGYTYYRQDSHQIVHAPSENGATLLTTGWFAQSSGSGHQAPATSKLSSDWKLFIDWLDCSLERPFYSGKKVTLSTRLGLRAAWIAQKIDIGVTDPVNFVNSPQSTSYSRNQSKCWGLGPRMGLETRYLFGSGIRMEGACGASLLYLQYTTLKHSEDILTPGINIPNYDLDGYQVLHPSLEAFLGIAWGRYIYNNAYHIDLSLNYEFNYLWGYNQIRAMNDLIIVGTGAAANDLFLHGVTLSMGFTF